MGALLRRWWLSRPVIVIGTLAIVAAITIFLLLPLAVSTDVVRDRLEREIGNWAGHEVSLGDAPKLSFWPVPQIELNNVQILPRVYADAEPVMRADSIVADFSLVSAAFGSPEFSDFRIVRPTFNLEIYPDGSSNWTSAEGALMEGIEAAVALDKARQSETVPEPAITIPDSAAVGSVTIIDGTLNWVRDPGAPAERLSAINGTISWPAPRAEARSNLTAIFRGEQLKIDASTTTPLLLIGQRRAPLQLSIASAPLNLQFNGDIDLSRRGFANGQLSLRSPSVRRVLEWWGTNVRPGQSLGTLELDAHLSTDETTAKLDDLILNVDGNRGIGVLDVAIGKETKPAISGTLAFNTLDIASFLRAFTPLPKNGREIASTIDTRFLRELGLDLRLSAQSAQFGPIALSNLAAAARVEEGRATFDLGDATAYGGNVIGRIVVAEAGPDGGATLQLSARNMDFGALYDAVGLTGPLPRGIGMLDIELSTPYPTWATTPDDLTGKFSLTLGQGTLPRLDLAAFRDLAATKQFFRLDEAMKGSGFAFSDVRFAASIGNGQAEITEGRIVGAETVIMLGGVVPYLRGSLALAGALAPAPQPDNAETAAAATPTAAPPIKPRLRFFLGGSWPEPVISPVSGDN